MFPVNTYHDYFGTTIDVLTTCYSYLIDIKENEFFRAPKITQNQDKNHELGIKLFVMRVQTCLNISQAFPVCDLGKSKTEELIVTGKFPDSAIAIVFLDIFFEFIKWQMFQNLCKNGFPDIH